VTDAAELDFPFDPALRFGAIDDSAHEPGPTLDWAETLWWSFNVPERGWAGWLYTQLRPNAHEVTGGAFVYDDRGTVPWELPYFGWFSHQPLPDTFDLRHASFRNGCSVRVVDPGMRYELGYRFRDHKEFTANLLFEGLIPPVPHLHGAPPFTESSHYDQPGRVTGTMTLRGETVQVDSLSVRDRSWGRRPEHIGRTGRLSYAFGSATEADAFLVFCTPVGDDPADDREALTSGYLFRDGAVRRMARANRRVVRDPVHGWVRTIEIDGVDTDGRVLHAVGHGVSQMFLPGHSLCINTFVRWDIGGRTGWGEDQDVWSMALMADRARGTPSGP